MPTSLLGIKLLKKSQILGLLASSGKLRTRETLEQYRAVLGAYQSLRNCNAAADDVEGSDGNHTLGEEHALPSEGRGRLAGGEAPRTEQSRISPRRCAEV